MKHLRQSKRPFSSSSPAHKSAKVSGDHDTSTGQDAEDLPPAGTEIRMAPCDSEDEARVGSQERPRGRAECHSDPEFTRLPCGCFLLELEARHMLVQPKAHIIICCHPKAGVSRRDPLEGVFLTLAGSAARHYPTTVGCLTFGVSRSTTSSCMGLASHTLV